MVKKPFSKAHQAYQGVLATLFSSVDLDEQLPGAFPLTWEKISSKADQITFFVLRLFCFLTIACVLSTHRTFAVATDSEMQQMLDLLVQRNDGFGGGVARVAGPNGVIWESATGSMAGRGSPAMQPNTPFEIASITKAVTAAAILRMVEENQLSLETKISEILPDQAKGFAVDPTIRQLLSHTSGLLHYWEDGPKDADGNNAFLREFLANPDQLWSPNAILAHARRLPVDKPGRGFHYSDTNYVLLGLVLEKLTKQPLATAYRTWVFKPLGMKDTWLTYHEAPKGKAPSHRFEGSEDLHNIPRQSADWAGGGLVSTTQDLEKFLRGLASGKFFKNPETLKTMLTPVSTGDAGIAYGLGLYIVQLGGGKGDIWGHDGHGNSFAYYWPSRDVTFTGTLNQTENDWWPLVDEFTKGGNPRFTLWQNDQTVFAELSSGWDSLYMDKGVNSLRDNGGYGSGIYWNSLSLDYAATEADILSLSAWYAVATSGTAYQELDLNLDWTRLFGPIALSLGYAFNYGYADANYYSHELGATASYEIVLGAFTLTPSVQYTFSLGPDASAGTGFVETASSFLALRLDGSLPVWNERLFLQPWTALGVNFRYTTRPTKDEDTEPFTGLNNWECGLAIPFQVTRILSFTVFGAYSRALTDLSNTETNTFWGGASVGLSF